LHVASIASPANADGAAGYAGKDWTGFYAGLNLGVIVDDSRYTLSPSGCFVSPPFCANPANNPLRTDSGNFDNSAFTGGVEVGYNRNLNGLVLGAEADINYSGLDDDDPVDRPLSAPLAGRFIHNVSLRLNSFGSVRGRIGITPSANWLLYVTGGLAFGRIQSATTARFTLDGDTYVGSYSSWRSGSILGGGAEYRLASNWSAKLEYLHIDLGSLSYDNPCVTPAVCAGLVPAPKYQTSLDLREDVIRVGLNYHFGSRFDPLK
jgi:outer membrane immunogenic protein